MLLKNTSKRIVTLSCILFGAYIAVVLWITLLSRLGDETRLFLFPFHSYVEILKGNWQSLFENICNVVMLVPLGILMKCIGVEKNKTAAVVGFAVSLLIETLQYTLELGTFEFDDLLHNTMGAVSGFYILKRIAPEFRIKLSIQTTSIILISMIFCALVPFINNELKHQKMIEYAAPYDRVDGTKNLLILYGDNGKAWDTDVRVKYLDDGSIHIKGTSAKRSWWPIGELTVEPGEYSFSGLSGVAENTVGLELETDNHRFAPDVGPVDEIRFTVSETTELMVYVTVYEGCDCDVVARPVIYKEE